MALFRISGIWMGTDKVLTHYGFHTVNIQENTATRVEKISKSDAIRILEQQGNKATTWIWDYSLCRWKIGEEVEVVNGPNGKYLRSNPDKKETNNLLHLINYDWIKP